MTDANRILDAADKAASDHFVYDDIRPLVAAVLREMSKRPDDWNRYELADLADEIEGSNDD